MNSFISKRNVHAKQCQLFPHSLISQHGILKLRFISMTKQLRRGSVMTAPPPAAISAL